MFPSSISLYAVAAIIASAASLPTGNNRTAQSVALPKAAASPVMPPKAPARPSLVENLSDQINKKSAFLAPLDEPASQFLKNTLDGLHENHQQLNASVSQAVNSDPADNEPAENLANSMKVQLALVNSSINAALSYGSAMTTGGQATVKNALQVLEVQLEAAQSAIGNFLNNLVGVAQNWLTNVTDVIHTNLQTEVSPTSDLQ